MNSYISNNNHFSYIKAKNAFSSMALENKEPLINVVAYLDGNASEIEGGVIEGIQNFEIAKSLLDKRVQITAKVETAWSKVKPLAVKTIMGFAAGIMPPLALFILKPIGELPSFILGGATLITSAFITAKYLLKLKECINAIRGQKKCLPNNDWKGNPVYNIQMDKTPEINTIPTEIIEGKDSSKPEDLSAFIADNMQKYNSAKNVFYISGHGLAYKGVAGISMNDLKKALDKACVKIGKKLDIIIFDACFMQNLETMNEIKNYAKIAVASEETVPGSGFPIHEMLDASVRGEMIPENMGEKIIEGVGLGWEINDISTVSAVNLEKLDQLTCKLDILGIALSSELEGNDENKEIIKSCLNETLKFNDEYNEKDYTITPSFFSPIANIINKYTHILDFLYACKSKQESFADLGDFLSKLEARNNNFSDKARKALQDTQKTLENVVIAAHGLGDYKKAKGISFHYKQDIFFDNIPNEMNFRDLNLPDGWKRFIEKIGWF